MRSESPERLLHSGHGGGAPDSRQGPPSFGRRLRASLFVCVFAVSLLSAGTSASAGTRLTLITAHSEGGDYFDLVARDTPGVRVVLYVDGKPGGKARANPKGRLTFPEVRLTGTGRLSFSTVLTGHNGKSHQRPTGYIRFYNASGESVRFSRTPLPPLVVAPSESPAPVAPEPPPPPPSPVPVCTNGTYVNSAGNTVCSPEPSPTVPPGATARCVDGTYSFSESRSGTCSHHGGVAEWLS